MRACIAATVMLLLVSGAYADPPPKYVGEVMTCEEYAYPGNTVNSYWRALEAKILSGWEEEGYNVPKSVKIDIMNDMKARLDEIEDLLVWGEYDAEQWAKAVISYRLMRVHAQDRPGVPEMILAGEYITNVWYEIGFIKKEEMSTCDSNPNHKVKDWLESN